MKRLKSILLAVIMLCSFMITACGPASSSYTVTLMDGKEIIKTIEKDKDTHLAEPDAVVKDGYTFKGWYVDAELTTPYEPAIFSANLTLYAKYEKETLYLTFNLNGGVFETETERLAVKHGESYEIPTPVKEGFDFIGWTLDGEKFASSGTYERTKSAKVAANWAKCEYTVTFKNGEDVLGTEKVEHGDKAHQWTHKGYTVQGYYEDKNFTTEYDFNESVVGNIDVYVKVQAKTFNLIVNEASDVNVSVKYGEEYQLEQPVKEGYEFKKFTYKGEDFSATGEFKYVNDVYVTAVWEKQAGYEKSSVYFYDGEKEIAQMRMEVENGYELSELASAPPKDEYAFDGWFLDAGFTVAYEGVTVNEDLRIYAKYIANDYEINVDLDGGTFDGKEQLVIGVKFDGDYEIPVPYKYGYKCVGYLYNGQEFPAEGKYGISGSITVKAVWEELRYDQDETGDQTFIKVGGANGYYKERKNANEEFTYVFLTGVDYDLTKFGTLVKIDGEEFTTVNFSTVAEDLEMEITTEIEGMTLTFERGARVVNKVFTYDVSGEYNNLWGAQANRTNDFMDAKADAVMSVGKDNYIPDIVISKDDIGTVLSMQDAYVSVVAKVDGQVTEDYDFDAKDGQIDFGETLVGKVVELTFTAKYATDDAIVMNVKVNAGVNVYTNQELRVAYGNHRDVSEINVLRNIKAEIGANDYVSGKNHPINKYEYGVYTRMVSSGDDKITVNGNFFTIDGSELPLGHNGVDGRDWSVAGELGYYMNNMQIGFFLYNCESTTGENEYMHNGQATFNDLYIRGNVGEDVAETEEYNAKELLIYSGAYHGIVCRGGRIAVNNTTINKTNIAIFSDGGVSITDGTQQASQWKLDGVKLLDSWGNQVYMYDFAKVEITNSYLGACGGAAIHLDDIAYKATETTLNTVVTLDEATIVENFIAGSETWFVGHGKADLAGQLKTRVENGLKEAEATVSQLTGSQIPATTIIKKDNGAERMNFVILVRGVNSEAADWTGQGGVVGDQNGSPYIETNLPLYIDLENYNATLHPAYGKKAYMAFSTASPKPETVKDYMLGIVEVMLAK